ncbi:MAG: diguanylate cyclase [Bacteroides sp.]|nr:diguanylate cyclase [Bacteroides sp.]MCM1531490.1 diguanylate cyclase [Ruminococcus flavefaciens]MCM1554348.1 diguanylate cyclase [Bacteroides sp.]
MDKIFEELNIAITVCKADGEIIGMNRKSKAVNLRPGQDSIIGQNVLDCHPEPARTKLQELLAKQATNAYTIEKNGVKKLIYQTPWYENGEFQGLVEFSIEIPFEMPHYVRQPKQ